MNEQSEQQKEQPKYELLPTGKPHVSYSEIRDWAECSYRHKLKHISKVGIDEPSPFLDFGKAVHSACESFLLTRVMDASIATNVIKAAWEKNAGMKGFDAASLAKFTAEAEAILLDLPTFMDATFQSWSCVAAEHELYEPLKKHQQAFKGFVDAIISAKDKKGKDVLWIIDFKTTSWGWSVEKKSDTLTKTQLVYYKSFWSEKVAIPIKNIKCGFLLLKRTAKAGNHCELVPVSIGDITINRSLKLIDDMLVSVKRGVAVKNRLSCTYCAFKDTQHCT